jgi:hypothetical protein
MGDDDETDNVPAWILPVLAAACLTLLAVLLALLIY